MIRPVLWYCENVVTQNIHSLPEYPFDCQAAYSLSWHLRLTPETNTKHAGSRRDKGGEWDELAKALRRGYKRGDEMQILYP